MADEQQLEDDVMSWVYDSMHRWDLTDEERAALREDFRNRVRGKWTVKTYTEHAAELVREMRMGF